MLLSLALLLGLSGQSHIEAQGDSATKANYPFVRATFAHSIIFTASVPYPLETNTLMYINLEQQRGLRLSFDLLEDHARLLGYRLTHCNADWSPSLLNSSEALEGFAEGELEVPLASNATLTSYQHYNLNLDPETLRFRASGNYLLTIYDLDAPEQILLALPLLVAEHCATTQASVRDRSWQGHSTTHQYISCRIPRVHLSLTNPEQWLSIQVLQNGQWEGLQSFTAPSSVEADEVIYSLSQALPFSGGREYYRIEHLEDYQGAQGIGKLERESSRITAQATPHWLDSLAPYLYEPDLDGKQVIRTTAPIDPDTEADYHWVEFILRGEPIEGKVLLQGEAFAFLPESSRQMTYDPESKSYRLRLPMKVGYQEYQFVRASSIAKRSAQTSILGSHSQTTNTYAVLTYLRTPSDRADRLLDLTQLRYRP